MVELAPSILAADFLKLGEQIREVLENGVHYLHLDVMDGHFVPSISFGMPVIASIRKQTSLFFDVHLMVEEPERYLKDLKEAGADGITVHAEACRHLHRTVEVIKEMGLKVGVALNPATPVSMLMHVWPILDLVLIMSVDPGFGGQEFLPFTLDKIRQVKRMSQEAKKELLIEVDGGIYQRNAKKVLQAGANLLVAGTAVFQGDISTNIREFKEVFIDANTGSEAR